MKKTIFVLLILATVIACLCLCGCTPYNSSFKAKIFVHSNTNKSAAMSYTSFEGTYVFKMKTDKEKSEVLEYSGHTDMGDVTVYYDCDGSKNELFSLHAGDTLTGSVDLPTGAVVYVIVETDGAASDGSFTFAIR